MSWSFLLIFSPLAFLGGLWLLGLALIKVAEWHERGPDDESDPDEGASESQKPFTSIPGHRWR